MILLQRLKLWGLGLYYKPYTALVYVMTDISAFTVVRYFYLNLIFAGKARSGGAPLIHTFFQMFG